MTTHYTPTNEGGMSFTSTRRPGEVRIPNYVYDIWMPLLGIEAIGVYAVYCRLEREGTVKAMSQQRIAQEMRIGVNRLKKTNDLLKRYGFIDIRQPESYEKLMHYTTEITVHDPPRTASAATILELKHPKGYETLCPWLTETEPQPIGNAGDTNKSCANQSNGNANVAPPVFAPSVVAEEPPLAESSPDALRQQLDDLLENDPAALVDALEAVEDPAFWAEGETPPKPSPQEPVEQRVARLRDEYHIEPRENVAVPLEMAKKVVQNRAAVAHPDGGDASKDRDPWVDITVREWARISGKDFKEMPIGTKLKLAGIFRKVGAIAESGAVPVGAAIARFPIEHEWWAKKVGFEWPSDSFCNKLGMMLVPDVEPESSQPTTITFIEPAFARAGA